MTGQPPPVAERPSPGRLVFVTHPQPRADAVCARLRRAGLDAHALPAFGLQPLAGPALAEAAARLSAYDMAIMVSPTAVTMLTDALGGRSWPAGTVAAVVGRGSRDALSGSGAQPAQVLMPAGSADADALMAEPALQDLAGRKILLVRGQTGRDDVAVELSARGARVDELRAYARTDAPWPEAAAAALAAAADQCAAAIFVFTTTAGAERIEAALAGRDATAVEWAHGRAALAVHPRIAAALAERGWSDVRAIDPGIDALVATLESG